ncbi:MAG: ABC transporter permease [bacterium]
MSDTMIPAHALSERVIQPRHGIAGVNLKELWSYRELFGFLVWRNVIIRYKQTLIGIVWAVLQPVLTMIIFTAIFGHIAKLPSGGAPYTVMTFVALLPWQFFANSMSQSSNSLINSSNLITKVYFPRLIIPASATISGVIDFLIAFIILLGLMVWYHLSFSVLLLLLPAFFFIAFIASFGIGLWLSALNVKYRDVKYVVPFLIRMGLYISPVGFISSVVPGKWRFVYSLNPMVGVIDGFRWCILGEQYIPYWPGFWASVVVVFILLCSGVIFFKTTEKTFSDII